MDNAYVYSKSTPGTQFLYSCISSYPISEVGDAGSHKWSGRITSHNAPGSHPDQLVLSKDFTHYRTTIVTLKQNNNKFLVKTLCKLGHINPFW